MLLPLETRPIKRQILHLFTPVIIKEWMGDISVSIFRQTIRCRVMYFIDF